LADDERRWRWEIAPVPMRRAAGRPRSELDAIFAQLNHLDRDALEWNPRCPYPSASHPGPKRKELAQFCEYPAQRTPSVPTTSSPAGELPDLEGA